MNDPNKPSHIYVLIDPRDGAVRYVGVAHDLRKRFSGHLRAARLGSRRYCSCWIRKLLSLDMTPIQKVIETVDGDSRDDAERRWIARYRTEGAKLTNLTDGGEGTVGVPREIIERTAAKNRGRHHTEEAKRLIGDACRGKPRADETRAAIRAKHIGKVLTEEHRAKLAAAKLGKKLPPRKPEHSAKIADGLRRAHARRRANAALLLGK